MNLYKMTEEFQESDIIFQHDSVGGQEDHFDSHNNRCDYQEMTNNKKSKRQKNNCNKQNAIPINVPENLSRSTCWYIDSDLFDGEYAGGDGGITPPHVVVGRRIAGKMAFSVCTGNGRTLKGRDLSHFRNSILRMTGFLET